MEKDLNIDFFGIKTNNEIPEKGKVLISEPFSQDMYFKRSIVLLAECNEDGAIGFILNKPIDIKLNDVISNFPKFDTNVSLGGPVNADRIFFIHTLGSEILPGSIKIFEDIYWGGDFFKVKDFIKKGLINKSQIRFFLGYSGWSQGQLDNELKNNYWLVSNIKDNQVFDIYSDIWKQSVENLDEQYKIWLNFPENPAHN